MKAFLFTFYIKHWDEAFHNLHRIVYEGDSLEEAFTCFIRNNHEAMIVAISDITGIEDEF